MVWFKKLTFKTQVEMTVFGYLFSFVFVDIKIKIPAIEGVNTEKKGIF